MVPYEGALTSTPAGVTAPSTELWDKIYKTGEDKWTNNNVCKELFKFQDVLTDGATGLDILLPLCGRTKMMLWLAEKGHRVVGIEWSDAAVKMFFKENGLSYEVKPYAVGEIITHQYTATEKAVTIYCGDYFAFKEDNLGGFDCIFDHASIGSFPEAKRAKYAEITSSFAKSGGRMVLSIFDYEHEEHPSMPFAVTEAEVVTLYKDTFSRPKLLQEYNAEKTYELFNYAFTQFLVCTFSRFAWKVLFLIKHQPA